MLVTTTTSRLCNFFFLRQFDHDEDEGDDYGDVHDGRRRGSEAEEEHDDNDNDEDNEEVNNDDGKFCNYLLRSFHVPVCSKRSGRCIKTNK